MKKTNNKAFTMVELLATITILGILSIIGMIIGSKIRKASKEEEKIFDKLHIKPSSENDVTENEKTHKLMYLYIGFGIVLGLFFIFFYALPYLNALN